MLILLGLNKSAHLIGQYTAPINVIIDNEPFASENEQEYNLIRADLVEQISNAPQLYNLLERDNYDELINERQGTQKLGEDLYLSSILEGASVLIKLTINEYIEEWDSVKITKPEVGYLFNLKITVGYGLQMVDLSTTEVKDYRVLKAQGMSKNRILKLAPLQKHELKKAAFHYLRQSMYILNRTNILQMANLKIPILEISESHNKEAQKLVIEGGNRASYVRGLILKVVRETTVKVKGEDKIRVETMGDIRIDYCGRELSICNVLNGRKEIFESISSKGKVYCLFSEKNEIAKEWFAFQKDN